MNAQTVYQWTEEIGKWLGAVLNSWQVVNVGLMSYAVIKGEGSQQQRMARAMRSGERVDSAARRIRRFISNPGINVALFFVYWVAWVAGCIGDKRVTLLVDETKLHDKLGVMVVGLAWQKRCLPLAWRVYRANAQASYPPEGQVAVITQLLQIVNAGLPDGCEVCVLADRGIGCSPKLCQAVRALGWHFLFRVTCQTKLVNADGEFTIAHQVQPGQMWLADGLVFKRRGRIPAHARAVWSVGYAEPWALVTSDPTLTGYEYAQRHWQEQSFRDLKSAGWHWNDSRLRNPDHAARLLIVLVIAYVWVVALGSQAVAAGRAAALVARAQRPPARLRSLFREGLDFFAECVESAPVLPVFFTLRFLPDFRCT